MIITAKKLDETDKKILQLSGDGLTAKEIAYKLNRSRRSIEYRIYEMKKWYKCKSLAHLVKTLALRNL